jgi:hypothetical protein
MLFPKLSSPLEAHAELLAGRIQSQVGSDPHLPNFRELTPAELEEFVTGLVGMIASWADESADQIRRGVESIHDVCARRSIPLCEAAYGAYVVRDELLDFLRAERKNTEPDYDPAHELELRVSRFFDLLVAGLLRSYDKQLA